MTTAAARTVSISIDRDSRRLYAFVRAAENFPKWVAFCKAIRRSDDAWTMETEQGSMTLRFVEDNPHGVLDHVVNPAPGVEVYVPMRVVPNGSGSEVIFTVFRAPEMTDEKFLEDVALVERDLGVLKGLVEGTGV